MAGSAVAGNVSTGSSGAAVGFSMGGFGAAGGTSSFVTVTNSSSIQTLADDSIGIFAQSLGGGGGNGGFSVAGGITTGSAATTVDLSIGGFAGAGGNSGNVILTNSGSSIYTQGIGSTGLMAQSVAGGGGNGGFSVAGSVSAGTNVNFSLGGFGGTGGDAGTVTVNNSSSIMTSGTNSAGIFAQSLGGGGGAGGFSVAAGISTGTGAKAQVNVSIGGFWRRRRQTASTVTVTNSGSSIYTEGDYSRGILAQSLGGGGGDGGFSVAGGISNSPDVNLSIGGSGSSGGNGMEVDVDSSSNITTHGYDSQGIFAQSVGGGGGDGGFSIAGGITKSGTSVSVSIGGFGGGGGCGGMHAGQDGGDHRH